jgi:hypothetical protein
VGRLDDRFAGQFDVGVAYLLTPRLALAVDAKRLFSRDVEYSPAWKASLGVGWRF